MAQGRGTRTGLVSSSLASPAPLPCHPGICCMETIVSKELMAHCCWRTLWPITICSTHTHMVEPAVTDVCTPGCSRCSFCPGAIAQVPFKLMSVTSMLLLPSCSCSNACCLLIRPRSSGWSGRATSAFGPARPRTALLVHTSKLAPGPLCTVRLRSIECDGYKLGPCAVLYRHHTTATGAVHLV
jgi:hypothetical protein